MDENIKSPMQKEDILEEKIKEVDPNIHVIRERINNCVMCGSLEDLRFGWCWDCAEAQSILVSGRTMMEAETGTEDELSVKLINERLKMLIEKGWKKTNHD